MSNGKGMDMNAQNEDRMHELLCAMVLGEPLEAAERERLEHALEASAELRAEHERLRATVALVGQAWSGAEDRLSAEVERTLLAAARRETEQRLPRTTGRLLFMNGPWLRAAAGFAVFLLAGAVAWRVTKGDGDLLQNERVARYEGSLGQPALAPAAPMTDGAFEPAPARKERAKGELSKDKSGFAELSAGVSPTPRAASKAAMEPPLGGTRFGVDSPSGRSRAGGTYRGPNTEPLPASTGLASTATPVTAERRAQSITDAAPGKKADAKRALPELERGLRARRVARHDAVPSESAEPLDEVLGLRGLGYLGGDAEEEDLRPATVEELTDMALQELSARFAPLPGESPRALYQRLYGDHPFVETREDALSTFAADVDDVSYLRTLGRLRAGQLPERTEVRVEEFVNHPAPDVLPPRDETFRLEFEAAPSRFGTDPNRWMLRVGLRAREVAHHEREPLALTFVIDVSGSMDKPERMPLVKDALRQLVERLDARDTVAIVSFSKEAELVLPATPATMRTTIAEAVLSLDPEGGTDAEKGLLLGYETAAATLAPGTSSRVVLLSDGIANLGETDHERITAKVAEQRKRGIWLNTVGVGMDAGGDTFLEQLADRGDGVASYMSSALEARRALVDNFAGAFVPVARDVKLQVEFAPGRVEAWRQLGYENRAIADQDFRDDAVDAGELGAGHQVVALYELEVVGGMSNKFDPSASLATVRVRWKSPAGADRTQADERASELELSVPSSAFTSWDGASVGYRRSVLLARFAELLRRSPHVRGVSPRDLLPEARTLAPRLADPDFDELVPLLETAVQLLEARPEPDAEFAPLVEALRANALRSAQLALARSAEENAEDAMDGADDRTWTFEDLDDDPAEVDLARERADVLERLRALLERRLREAEARGGDVGMFEQLSRLFATW